MLKDAITKLERMIVMFVSLWVYGAEFQMIYYKSEEEAKSEIKEHFDELVSEGRFRPEEDEAFNFKATTPGKDMEVVYST